MSATPCAQTLLDLIGKGERWLDLKITVRGCGREVEGLWRRAAETGRRWARRLWERNRDAEQNLERLGVAEVRWMSPMEELAYNARGVYDPSTRQVLVCRSRLEEMMDIQEQLGVSLFDREGLRERVLAHEGFHHLETTMGRRLDETLVRGTSLPGAIRDVGAQAFANEIFGAPPNQAVDVLWLAARRPDVLAEWEVGPGDSP